jgi:DNA-binding MarR family transcriptional regulator
MSRPLNPPSTAPSSSSRPVDFLEQATAYYVQNNYDVSYFPAVWHTFKVGHLLGTDLEQICQQHGISIADFHLLGAVVSEESGSSRAIDLAQRLNVSNAVLSTRIKKLQQSDLLLRQPCAQDRRSFVVTLTEQGKQVLAAAGDGIARRCRFIDCFNQLGSEDQQAFVRIIGELHNQLDRFSLSAGRGQL